MAITLGELVARLGGSLLGDPQIVVEGIAPLQEASGQHITFLSNPRLRAQAQQSQAAAIIVTENDAQTLGEQFGGARIICRNPYVYFARASQLFAAKPTLAGFVHPSAWLANDVQLDPSARIGAHVCIEAGAVIGKGVQIDAGCVIGENASIGDDCHFHANVSFHAGCKIGQRGIVHSGAVIGADGFGFANEDGQWIKIAQTGAVVIGHDVEIGANTCIDRGALADTIIEDGVKLDNLIQIGHNCRIGAHTAMAGCVGVAGSAIIGKYCTFGGAAMVLGHLTIADKVHVSSGSMVASSITESGAYTGFYPLAKKADWEKSAAIVRNLTAMREKIRLLEKAVKSLTETGLEKNHE